MHTHTRAHTHTHTHTHVHMHVPLSCTHTCAYTHTHNANPKNMQICKNNPVTPDGWKFNIQTAVKIQPTSAYQDTVSLSIMDTVSLSIMESPQVTQESIQCYCTFLLCALCYCTVYFLHTGVIHSSVTTLVPSYPIQWPLQSSQKTWLWGRHQDLGFYLSSPRTGWTMTS